MNRLEILKKFFFILNKNKQNKKYLFYYIIGLISVLLEILGISLVPILIISILDPSLLIEFTQKYNIQILGELVLKENSSIYLLFTFFAIYTIKVW